MDSIIFSRKLSKYSEIIHGISTQQYGNLRLSADFSDEIVLKNRRKFSQDLGFNLGDVINPRLEHKTNIWVVKRDNREIEGLRHNKTIPKFDGLITNLRGIILMITVADCLPIMFYDPINRVVGLVHAGWRGIGAGIISKMIWKLKREFGSKAKDIIVYIGPSIGLCHFEISKEVMQKFKAKFKDSILCQVLKIKDDRLFMNLQRLVKLQLLREGIKKRNIEINNECTVCYPKKYFSWRGGSAGKELKAMGAVIGLK